MQMLDMTWNVIAPRGQALLGGRAVPRWLPALLSTLAAMSLLVVYATVVREVADNGEARRVAVVAQSDALWRCYALRGSSERKACVQALGSTADGLAQADAPVTSP